MPYSMGMNTNTNQVTVKGSLYNVEKDSGCITIPGKGAVRFFILTSTGNYGSRPDRFFFGYRTARDGQTWGDAERGTYPDPRVSTLEAVGRALGCRCDDLLDRPAK